MATCRLPLVIRGLEPDDWPWIADRAAPVLCADTQGLVALRGQRLVAAAVFDSWSPNSCQSHIIIEDPFVLRHGFLNWAMNLVFVYNKRNLMTGLTPADNAKALKFNKHIGLREVYRIPEGYKPGVDFVLQEMRKDECRWLQLPQQRAA